MANQEELDQDIWNMFKREEPAAIERDKQRLFEDQLQHRVWPGYKVRSWALEPTLHVVSDKAHVTRSIMGYKVMNALALGIIDVDHDLRSDYHLRCHQDRAPQIEATLKKLRDWCATHPGQAWRAYLTAKGMRLIRTDGEQLIDRTFDALCEAVGADPYYREMVKEQRCYRARVTAKPLRVGLDYPHWSPYGYDDGEGWGELSQNILPSYNRAADALAERVKTCDFVAKCGTDVVSPELLVMVSFHDAACKVFSTLPMEQAHESEYAPSESFLQIVRNFDAQYRSAPTKELLATFEAPYSPERWTPSVIWDLLTDEARAAIQNNIDGTPTRQVEALEKRRARHEDDRHDAVHKFNRFQSLLNRVELLLMDVGIGTRID